MDWGVCRFGMGVCVVAVSILQKRLLPALAFFFGFCAPSHRVSEMTEITSVKLK